VVCAAQPAVPTANLDSATQNSAQPQPQTQDQPAPAPPSQTSADKGQTSQGQTSQDKSSSDQTSQPQSGQPQSGTSKDRLFFALPNFLTLESGRLPPLTPKQKFAVVARGSFDYIQIPWYAFLSGINQAEDSEPGLGQGWESYGKRYAMSFADGTIENFMVGAVMPTVLRQDPRYYQLGKGGFWHRTLYAMSRNLITLSDSGKKQFNFSEVVGGAMSSAISTYSYHPTKKLFPTTTYGVYRYVPSDRTLGNTAKVWGTQYGYDTMTLVVKEFWPDIRRVLLHKNRAGAASAPKR
jgi:hypothetical protein